MSAALDYQAAGDAGYTGDPSVDPSTIGLPSPDLGYILPGDTADAQKMQPWTPAAAGANTPWWQALIAYGATKAIDNHFPTDPSGIQGNTYPGSIAGSNGRTYSQRPTGAGGGVQGSGFLQMLGGNGGAISPLLIVGAVVLVALALRH